VDESASLTLKTLDPVLTSIIREHSDRVIGWIRDEPGCWGFLAGQAVAGCRRELGRSLEELERRLVWDRLWWLLETIKKDVQGG
jgi:hypothetical protein